MLLLQPHRKAVNSGYEISLKFFQYLAYNIMFHLYPFSKTDQYPNKAVTEKVQRGRDKERTG